MTIRKMYSLGMFHKFVGELNHCILLCCRLWPDLERTMRDVDLNEGHQVTPSGRLLS